MAHPFVSSETQGAYESIRTGILEPQGTEPERNHLQNDPRRNWIAPFRGWTRTHIPVQPLTDTFHLWTQRFVGWTQTRGSTPHWWLSSLNPTFRGWTGTHILVQPLTDTFHLWTSLFGVELGHICWFNPPLIPFISEHNVLGVELRPEVQPPTDGFHLWTSLFGVELGHISWFNPPLIPFISEHNFSGLNSDPRFQPPTDGFHLWTLLFGVELEPTSWFNPPLIPFISEHNFSGLNSDPRFNPPLMAFISEPHFSGLAHSNQYGIWRPYCIHQFALHETNRGNTNRNRTDFWFIHFARTETNPNEPKACWKLPFFQVTCGLVHAAAANIIFDFCPPESWPQQSTPWWNQLRHGKKHIFMTFHGTLQGTITYPTKRESRKIMDSKLPTGRGYVSSQESITGWFKRDPEYWWLIIIPT